MGHSAAVRILVSEAVAVERGHGVTMTEEASTAPGLRVLAHSEAALSGFTRPAADIFVYQGRTTHFTTLYSSGLLIHSPGDICLLTSDPGWRTSWSIIAPGNFSGRQFTDLLFYDPSAGLGEFYTTEGGNLSLLASDTGWRTSWSIIIPCNLTGGTYNDLLFYDAGGGTGEFYSTDGHGHLAALVMSNSGWRTSWSIIIPCNLTGGTYNDLLFYDPSAGVGEIYSTDGHGGMNLVATNAGWRTSWSVIAACNITGGRYDDLLFYDAAGGTGEIYTTDGHGHLAALVASHTDWRTSWSIVKPCNISGGKSSDLIFYDPSAGVGEFYSTDSGGNISLLHSADNWRSSWAIIAPANFTQGKGQDLLFYDRAGGTGEIYTTRGNTLSTAVLATCEADYEALRSYFGGLTPSGLPFDIDVQSGNSGASHSGCSGTVLNCDAFSGDDPDLLRMLVVSEADEVFMDNQGAGWDCGASNGEGLSRVLATHRYPHELNGFASGPSWLTSNRPDWVSNTEGTDQHFVSIGCATLFIHYLKFQLGYSFEQVTLVGGSTLAQTYQGLTLRADAFAPFKALIDRRFAAGTATPLSTDNPFPIHRDLLFYDPGAGTGEFYSTDIAGEISLLSSDTGWRGSWSLILPGNFSGRSFNDLLFYDAAGGTGEFYSTDGHGGISLLNTDTGWRTSWDMIIPARFGASRFDGLLFYDRAGGTGEFYTTDGHGRLAALLATHTDWRRSWTVILAGCFTRNGSPDLLFYDASAGLVEIYTTDVDGGISLAGSTANLPQDWTFGLTCNITGGQFMDLMFYRPSAGEVQFFTTDGEGSLLSLSTQMVGSNWSQIYATAFTEFLFYDASAGVGEYQRSTPTGAMTLLNRHTDWRQSWSLIAPGVYS